MSLNSRNDELNEKLDAADLPSVVDALIIADTKRKRHYAILAVSVTVEFILILGLIGGFLWNHSIATKAEKNRQAIIRNCETANDSRSKNKELWDFAFSLPPSSVQTPQQQSNLEKFKAKVDDTFMLRDCSALQ